MFRQQQSKQSQQSNEAKLDITISQRKFKVKQASCMAWRRWGGEGEEESMTEMGRGGGGGKRPIHDLSAVLNLIGREGGASCPDQPGSEGKLYRPWKKSCSHLFVFIQIWDAVVVRRTYKGACERHSIVVSSGRSDRLIHKKKLLIGNLSQDWLNFILSFTLVRSQELRW